MAEKFTVFAYDPNTNTRLAELPATNLLFDTRLNDAGSISFDLALSAPKTAARVAPILSYDGAPFAVYVDRNGTIVWGGLCLTGNYSKATGALPVQGKEFGAYFNQRIIAADYSALTYPGGIDPAQLVYKAYTDAQNVALCGPGASLGINVVGGSSTIPTFIPGYPITQHTTVSQIAADMAAVSSPGSGTVDVVFLSAWDPVSGAPVTTLKIWSPRAGRDKNSSPLVFDLASVNDYTWPTDVTKAGTTFTVTGAGSGAATPTAVVSSAAPVGGLGQMPRLDQVFSFSNVQSQSQLNLMAAGLAQAYGFPVRTPTVTLPSVADPVLGSWMIGDDARLYTAGDERFPAGKDEFWRIVQYATKVPDEGVATVTLTFNLPPII
ncbi:hypothetical protein [Subtercola vilae]|uniref:Uncharacterized protein n=1 Tax=Subtercola vilae TaxID=2056433 RepID=A0A4T2BV23_9MICO|nr:hypothetical protein [Subtercola vilae]TIH34979.1 hypothetical protein D4765_11845 [Subtercola vilae]